MKLVALGGTLGFLGLGLAVLTRGGAVQPEIARSGAEPVDSAMRTLSEAKALLDKGDTEGAVRKAAEIPEDSNARKTADYRQIQGAWADGLFAQVAATGDPAQKRALLDQISRATNVDSIRRKRAASELSSLGAESVDISDLPSAPKEPPRSRPNQPAIAPTPLRNPSRLRQRSPPRRPRWSAKILRRQSGASGGQRRRAGRGPQQTPASEGSAATEGSIGRSLRSRF